MDADWIEAGLAMGAEASPAQISHALNRLLAETNPKHANRHDAAVTHLLSLPNASPTARDERGHVPLCVAARHGNLGFTQRAVAWAVAGAPEASLDRFDSEGARALGWACDHGHVDLVKELVRGGAQPHALEDDEVSPIVAAAYGGHVDVVRFLAGECGVDVDHISDAGTNCLHAAVEENHTHVVEYLVREAQADVECVDDDGDTPVLIAAGQNNLPLVRFLVEEGKCNVNCVDSDGDTPLLRCAQAGYLDIASFLVHHCNADCQLANSAGVTPLWIACMEGRVAVVRMLGRHAGASVIECQNVDEVWALTVAARSGQEACVRWLLGAGGVWHQSALAEARQRGHASVERYLAWARDASPLLLAVGSGDVDLVIQRLHEGNDPFAANAHGELVRLADATPALEPAAAAASTKEVLALALAGWSPETHALHPDGFRRGVLLVLMLARRLRREHGSAMELPAEVWLLVVRHMPWSWAV